ncbi:MAG: hypothetical protein RL230_434, partial [Pseudomonadota bacterium]
AGVGCQATARCTAAVRLVGGGDSRMNIAGPTKEDQLVQSGELRLCGLTSDSISAERRPLEGMVRPLFAAAHKSAPIQTSRVAKANAELRL